MAKQNQEVFWNNTKFLSPTSPTRQDGNIKWQAPLSGTYKAKWNATVDRDHKRVRIRVVVRDHKGQVFSSLRAKRNFTAPTYIAETYATLMAVLHCKDMGFQ